MTWSKVETRPWTTSEAFGDWFFETWLVSRGWTLNWSFPSSGEKYFAISRTITNAFGDAMPINLVYELEYDAFDFNVYSFNGTDADYTAWSSNSGFNNYINGDTSFDVFVNAGAIHVWAESGTGAWIMEQSGRVMAMELADSGWLERDTNVSYAPATRPNRMILPLFDRGASNCGLVNITNGLYAINSITGRTSPDTSLFQDYAAISVQAAGQQAITCWEDPTGTWKMRAHQTYSTWDKWEVYKIDNEYYIHTGAFLLPVGTTEPTL